VDLTPIFRENIFTPISAFFDVVVTGLEFPKEFDCTNVSLVNDW